MPPMNHQDTTLGLNGNAEGATKQLNRVLASKTFRQADRLKRFLSFVVNETIAGRADNLKEFAVGVEVFDRDPSFDPRSDPIVRVQARRLRAQLERYYGEEAGQDDLIIEVPKGAYAVVFKPAKPVAAVPPKRSATPLLVSHNTVLALPFSDLSSDADLRHFCAGLDEEIVNALTKMDAVRLVVSGGVAANRGEWDLQEAAIRFNAAIVIRGSVRRSGAVVRISINLIDTVSGCYLWSTSLDRGLDDIFSAQEEVARIVGERLAAEMAAGFPRKGIRPPAQNLAAYNFYLQGRYHLDRRTEEGLLKAVDFFEKAIAEDGQYAQAYSGLSDAYGLLGHYGALSPAEVWTKAASNAAWAVLCDEHSVEAHTSLAHVKSTQDWDWAGAEREFQRAISLDSRYSTAHHWYAVSFLAPVGRMEEAREEMFLAQALDPISPIISRDIARIHYFMGDYEAALEQCDHTIELNPHFTPAYSLLGFVQERRGEFEESSAAFHRAIQLSPQGPSMQVALGHSLALSGKQEEALEILRDALDLASKRYVSPFELALLHFALGKTNEGFQWLEKAFQDRCFELVYLKVDPRLELVKSDPRFTALFTKLGLP